MKHFLIAILFLSTTVTYAQQQVIKIEGVDTIYYDQPPQVMDLRVVYLSSFIYNDSALKLISKFTGVYTSERKQYISRIYDTLQKYHIDDTLQFLHIHAAKTKADAAINWLGNNYNLLEQGTINFVADSGSQSASNSYYKTGYIPSTSTKFKLNSASFGCYITKNVAVAEVPIGVNMSGAQTLVFPKYIDNGMKIRINSSTEVVIPNTTANGLYIINRISSSQVKLLIKGTASTVSNTSTNVPNIELYVCAVNSTGNASYYVVKNRVAFDFVGGQLTGIQMQKLYEIFEWYLQYVFNGETEPLTLDSNKIKLDNTHVTLDNTRI